MCSACSPRSQPFLAVVSFSVRLPFSVTPNLPMSCSVVALSSLTVPVSTLASAGDTRHARHRARHQSAVRDLGAI